MPRNQTLTLAVWRESARFLDIEAALARVAPLVKEHLPFETILIRRLDATRGEVETVAAERCGAGQVTGRARDGCRPGQVEELLAWCHQKQVARLGPDSVGHPLATVLPSSGDREALVGPLLPEQAPVGVLVVLAPPRQHFGTHHEELVQALLEPFSVALENDSRVRELTALREAAEADKRSLLSRLGRHDISEAVVGSDTGLRAVMQQVELVAGSDVPVLILGETGSGKEVVARAIHTRSRCASGPFLRVNCGAIPPDLIDSELFGHERGSFTGAVNDRLGWFERADGGTLFLDECGELPPAAQVRLLRILQDGVFERVGGARPLHVRVRMVAATHRDLPALVATGRFREDLWYRLAVFPIQLPPLRDRREDIAGLAAHFALRAARRLGTPPLLPTPEDIDLLRSYAWPGNVRELAAVIERAAILGNGERLEVAQALGAVPPRPAAATPPGRSAQPVPEERGEFSSLDAAMTRHIEAALTRTRGRIEGPDGAAALLAINPHTLRARMRKLGVAWQRFRPVRAPRTGETREERQGGPVADIGPFRQSA